MAKLPVVVTISSDGTNLPDLQNYERLSCRETANSNLGRSDLALDPARLSACPGRCAKGINIPQPRLLIAASRGVFGMPAMHYPHSSCVDALRKYVLTCASSTPRRITRQRPKRKD